MNMIDLYVKVLDYTHDLEVSYYLQIRTEAGRPGRSLGAVLRKLEREFERVKEEYRAKLATVEETHRQQVKDTKRKQWVSTETEHQQVKHTKRKQWVSTETLHQQVKDTKRKQWVSDKTVRQQVKHTNTYTLVESCCPLGMRTVVFSSGI